MADQTLKTLFPYLQENDFKSLSGCVIKSYSHDIGAGPVLCAVHGWPQSAYMWRHVVPSWKDKIALFIPELPGYGFSSQPPAHDKRTVGKLIVEALRNVFGSDRPILWCGHDRGGRIGHRLIVDNEPAHRITSAILIDIVPTMEQWRAFANPAAATAYYHWPFLATPPAPKLIEAMGGATFTRVNLERSRGGNDMGAARFQEHDALAHYCHQFSSTDCIAGSCADYAAGATVDVQEQDQDQKSGRKVTIPLMIIYSASNLGRMHDVPAVWKQWVHGEAHFEGVEGGFGHYLPEECPEHTTKLVFEWIDKHAAQ